MRSKYILTVCYRLKMCEVRTETIEAKMIYFSPFRYFPYEVLVDYGMNIGVPPIPSHLAITTAIL